MTKDVYKAFQKRMNAPIRSKRQGNRSIYGCLCCLGMSLNLHKKFSRRRARMLLKRQDRKSFSLKN